MELTKINQMASIYSNIVLYEGQKNDIKLHVDFMYLRNQEKLE